MRSIISSINANYCSLEHNLYVVDAYTSLTYIFSMVGRFEWDEEKRDLNVEKHGLDFIDAVHVFDDPDRVERRDERKNYDEVRLQTIGKISVGDMTPIVLVVHTDRKEKIRIISARVAHSKERRIYEEKQNELE